ncbi:MAG TPA: aldo/keto reductase, partial [Thermoanaerobaculia bacterium]
MTMRLGMGNIVWSPLEGGWLSGKYRQGNPRDTARAKQWIGDLDNPKFARRRAVVDELWKVVEPKGVPLARFATAWVLRHPAVTSAIIGPRTLEQLEDSLQALAVTVSDDEAAAVDRLVPPGTAAL